MIEGKTYYEILEVDPSSSFETIKKAYRNSAFISPDKNDGKDSKFKDINSAYETLQDTVKRNQYDFEIQMLNNKTNYAIPLLIEMGISGFFSSLFQDKPQKSAKYI